MWERLSIASAAVLAVMSTVTTFVPPEGPWKLVWILAFYAVIAVGMWFAWKAIRDAEKESDDRHNELITLADGGDNFPYIEAIADSLSENSEGPPVERKTAILRGHQDTPLYDVSYVLRRDGETELVASGTIGTLLGAGHVGVTYLAEGTYTAYFQARNGEFSEKIEIVRDGKRLKAIMVVTRGINPRKRPWGEIFSKTTN